MPEFLRIKLARSMPIILSSLITTFLKERHLGEMESTAIARILASEAICILSYIDEADKPADTDQSIIMDSTFASFRSELTSVHVGTSRFSCNYVTLHCLHHSPRITPCRPESVGGQHHRISPKTHPNLPITNERASSTVLLQMSIDFLSFQLARAPASLPFTS